MDMDENGIVPRMGTFFIVLGVAAIVLFIISDIAETVAFDYLFGGLLMAGLGAYLRRNVEKPPPSGRFEWWKKMRDERKEKKKKG